MRLPGAIAVKDGSFYISLFPFNRSNGLDRPKIEKLQALEITRTILKLSLNF